MGAEPVLHPLLHGSDRGQMKTSGHALHRLLDDDGVGDIALKEFHAIGQIAPKAR